MEWSKRRIVASLFSESWHEEASACMTLTIDRNKYYLGRRHGAKCQPRDAPWADGAAYCFFCQTDHHNM